MSSQESIPPILLSTRSQTADTSTNSNNNIGHKDAVEVVEEANLTVDILIFNPPYVPTPHEEVYNCCSTLSSSTAAEAAAAYDDTNILTAAWAGGESGREVIDKFLPLISVSRCTTPLLLYEPGLLFIHCVDICTEVCYGIMIYIPYALL